MAKPMTDEQINAFFTDHDDESDEFEVEAFDNLIHCSAFATEFTDDEALDLYTSIAYRMFESQAE